MQSLELMDAAAVAAILKVSKSSILNWHYGRKTPPVGFPPPVKIGASVRWRSSDIHVFILGLPFATTGRIPTPGAQPTAQPKVVALDKPVRGRGRPRKIQTGRLG